MIRNLEGALEAISSDKAKERSAGLESTRNFLTDSAISRFNAKTWATVLIAISAAVKLERNAAVKAKNITQTQISRLQDASSLYRLTVEKCSPHINKKIVKTILSHVQTASLYRGHVYEYIAADTFKILTAIVSQQAHLDHLDHYLWLDIIKICFGTAFQTKINLTDDELEDNMLLSEDDEQEDELEQTDAISTSNKRLPNMSELTDLCTVLAHAFTSASASTLILKSADRYLSRVVRLLTQLKPKGSVTDVSAHLPLMQATNALLSQISCNCFEHTKSFAAKIWMHTLSLWHTKNPALKEQIMVALSRLGPIVLLLGLENQTFKICIQEYWEIVQNEAAKDRFRVDELSLDVLALHQKRPALSDPVFASKQLFASAIYFTQSQAVSWLMYELAAHCLAKLYQGSEQSTPLLQDLPEGGPSKRRKIEDPLTQFCDLLSPVAEVRLLVHYLQTLHFLVSYHWQEVHTALQALIVERLLLLLPHADANVINWAFLCLGVIASQTDVAQDDTTNDTFSPRKAANKTKSGGKRRSSQWTQIWAFSVRRLPNKASCRAAAQCAYSIMQKSMMHSQEGKLPLVELDRIVDDVGLICRDLNLAGPAFLFDSGCHFLRLCLMLARDDMSLFRLDMPERITEYLSLSRVWPTSSRKSQRKEQFTSSAVLALLLTIFGLEEQEDMSLIEDIPSFPACDAVWLAEEMAEIHTMQDFSLNAKVPPAFAPSDSERGPQTMQSTGVAESSYQIHTASQMSALPETLMSIATRILGTLESRLKTSLPKSDPGEAQTNQTFEQIHSAVHLAVLATVFDANLRFAAARAFPVNPCAAAVDVFQRSVNAVNQSRHTLDEIQSLLYILRPILVHVPFHASCSPLLQGWLDLKHHNHNESGKLKLDKDRIRLLSLIWTSRETFTLLDGGGSLLSFFKSFLMGQPFVQTPSPQSQATQGTSMQARTMDVDSDDSDSAFGTVAKSQARGPLRTRGLQYTSQAVMAGDSSPHLKMRPSNCLRSNIALCGLVTIPWVRDNRSTNEQETLSSALLEVAHDAKDCDPAVQLDVIESVANFTDGTSCGLQGSMAQLLLERLGEDILASYTYGRSNRTMSAALSLLTATFHLWASGSDDRSQATSHARALCSWLTDLVTKSKVDGWRIRIRLQSFLDQYVHQDCQQSTWGDEDNHPRRKETNQRIVPLTLLPVFIQDIDFRVRFRSGLSIAHAIRTLEAQRVQYQPFFLDLSAQIATSPIAKESLLTQIVCLSNVMVSAPFLRRAPYYEIISLAASHRFLLDHITNTLRATAARVNIDGLRVFHDVYASYIAKRCLEERKNIFQIPDVLFGYTSAKERFRSIVAELGSQYLLYSSVNEYSILKNACACSQQDLLLLSMPIYCAELLLNAAFDSNNRSQLDGGMATDRLDRAWRPASDHWKRSSSAVDAKFMNMVENRIDEIAVRLIISLDATNWSVQSLQESLTWAFPAQGAAFSQAFASLTENLMVPNVDKQTKVFAPAVVFLCYSWLGSKYPALFRDVNIVYNICQRLLTLIATTPFAEDQGRFVLSLILVLTFSYGLLDQPALIRLVASGLTHLYKSPALVPAVWAPLSYLLQVYAESKTQDIIKTFPSILVQLYKEANVHLSAGDHQTVEYAKHALEQIRRLVETVYPRAKESHVRSVATFFAALQSDQANSRISVAEALSIFNSLSIRDGRFTIVRSLATAVLHEKRYDAVDNKILWKLIESIRPSNSSVANVRGLADLLTACSDETPVRMPSCQEESKTREPDVPAQFEDGNKREIVAALAAQLTNFDPRVTDNVCQSLRSIFQNSGQTDLDACMPLTDDISRDLQIFAASSYSYALPTTMTSDLAAQLSDLSTSAWLRAARDFEEWIKSFSALLASIRAKSDPFYGHLVNICAVNAEFSQRALPMLTFSLVNADPDKVKNVKALSSYFEALLSLDSTSVACLHSVIATIMHLRRFQTLESTDAVAGDTWLQLSWRKAANGALRSQNAAASLLCLELAREHQAFDVQAFNVDKEGEKLLLNTLAGLGEPDSFYGHRSSNILDGLMRKYKHEHDFEAAFETHGAIYESNPRQEEMLGSTISPAYEPIAASLAAFGFTNLGMNALQQDLQKHHSSSRQHALQTSALELAWRTETWDLPVNTKDSLNNFDANIFRAFRSVYLSTSVVHAKRPIEQAYRNLLTRLERVSKESPTCSSKDITGLLLTREIDNFVEHRLWQDDVCMTCSPADFRRVPSGLNFQHCEAILNARVMLIRSVRRKEEADQAGDELSPLCCKAIELEQACHLELSKVARRAGRSQVALNEVIMAQKLLSDLEGSQDKGLQLLSRFIVEEELANVLWHRSEHTVAMDILGVLLLQCPVSLSPSHKALLLSQMGTWTATARTQNARDIRLRYFEPAIQAISDQVSTDEFVQVYHQYLVFADNQLTLLDAQAAAMLKIEADIGRKRQQLSQIDTSVRNTNENSEVHNTVADSAFVLDQEEIKLKSYNSDRTAFLHLTIQLAVTLTSASDKFDEIIFRFVSLWFGHAFDEALNAELCLILGQIPSAKFVFLAPQLTARLTKQTNSSTSFKIGLEKLVERLCLEHPFHLLHLVFVLKQSSEPRPRPVASLSRSKRASLPTHSRNLREEIADNIITKLQRKAALHERLNAFQTACDAYIEWAAYNVAEYEPYTAVESRSARHGRNLAVPPEIKLLRLRNLPIPVSTYDLPIDATCKYAEGSYPTIARYETTFKTSGGINLPKTSVCRSSDGKAFKQLFKGGDDIRQDAVMEQVFRLINTLLSKDEQTHRRELRLRTYCVIPLGPNVGLLEFVPNSAPLSEVMGNTLAMMRPTDWTYPQCRKHMGNTPHTDTEARVKKLQKIFEHNQPVFRYYFLANRKQPNDWFEMRLAYQRSVSVNSMVGHILGIGDRHVSNLLLDTATGELVPIDFGITFDAGLRLGQPELIPFRLTRNIIDGFGMTGVEGVYRRCCEETLRLLREQAAVIMTILEVFKYDPLQKWDISEAKKLQTIVVKEVPPPTPTTSRNSRNLTPTTPILVNTDDTDDDVPAMALQSLAGVAEKLKPSLSIEYTVNDLIQQAMDVKRLASIFPGWQPWI